MASTGLLSQATITGQPLASSRVAPMASSHATGTQNQGASGNTAGITANDFLTLLVTEMKNQDPTANTNPNEYINQLVNVNSLQQLISINETLTGAFNSSNVNTRATPMAQVASPSSVANGRVLAAETADVPANANAKGLEPASGADGKIQALLGRFTHGNLSAPQATPAANRLAHALDGRASMLPQAK